MLPPTTADLCAARASACGSGHFRVLRDPVAVPEYQVMSFAHTPFPANEDAMSNEAVTSPPRAKHTKLSREQITGFWGAWVGWTLDGMDSVIYALVLSSALTE